jgi:chaperonin GroEL
MNAKRVQFTAPAREKALRDASRADDAVRLTLGPRSKSVLIQKKWGASTVRNAGVTLARKWS